jgi:predicted ATPase/DNA-binding SARP family transcriptional activator
VATRLSLTSARVPSPLTPLIGRDGRVEAASRALDGTRLLTLTGSGGSGKTRLAVELASRHPSAAWIELAPLSDARFLAEYVATTLGVPDRKGKPSLTQIVERLATRPLLLVLDNCEHLVEPAARLVSDLLRECPALKVLATSREALGVAGERTFLVEPLSLPAAGLPPLQGALASDAVALFVERAQDVRASFALTEKNAAAISRICRRLDGIPLAIELAAARVRALDPEQLADRLESSVGLLDTGSRAALPRHRTIRDTIEWSYRLLTDEERVLLRRLSVFHGTFSLDAVEGVCAEPAATSASTLDLVTGLLDKSLLLCDPGDAGTRYRLIETVREYAAEKLRDVGETDAIRERHARFFVSLAERAAPAIFGGGGDDAWMIRLDEEAPNFRDVHDWCEQQTDRLELSLRLAVALHWHWYARGRFNEGRLRLGIALTFADQAPPLLRGRALTVLGRLAIWQGDYAGMHGPMEEAVALLRPLGDSPALAYALHSLAIAAGFLNHVSEARRLIDEAAAMAGDSPGALGAWNEYWRGLVAEWDDDADAARQAYERALALGRQLGHKPATAHALCVLGRLAAATGNEAAASSALNESLALFRDIEDRWGMAHVLLGHARLAAASGHSSRAAALLGTADTLRDELSIELSPPDRQYRDATIAAALTGIGEPAFWCAWAEGRKQSLDDAVAAALAPPLPASGDTPPVPAPAATLDLKISALGILDVHTREGRVQKSQWGSNRARELLLFLACHRDGCTKAQIGVALWPDASPAQLRNTFHVTLHRLRNALGIPDAIQVDGERYRINPSLAWELDADLFEREVRAAVRDLRAGVDATAALAAASARYRGDFLAGEAVGEWADEHRDRLRRLHLGALDTLGRALMERERYVEAAEAFSSLLAVDPVNEDACRRHMLCLAHLGDRASALRAYDALVRALRDDLGVKPGRDTVALRDKLAAAAT